MHADSSGSRTTRRQDVFLVTDKLSLVSDAELAKLERAIGSPLPPGYREYVTTLGRGEFCGELWVFDPDYIIEHFRERRGGWTRNFFWKEGDILRADVVESIICAYTYNGDDLVFCPRRPDRLVALPRHEDEIVQIERGLHDPLACCLFGEPVPFQFFISTRNRRRHEFTFRSSEGLDGVADAFIHRWGDAEVRWWIGKQDSPDARQFLLKQIGGYVQLTQDGDDLYRLWMTYDADSSVDVEQFLNLLESGGR